MSHHRPHDLLRIADPGAHLTGSEPAWVGPSLAAAPWVVVRRSTAPTGQLAVGVRGQARHERHALFMPINAAIACRRPEDLRPVEASAPARTPALSALQEAGPILHDLGLPWGPTGSVGFELATRRPTTTATSDLDLLIRTESLPSPARAAELIGRLSALSARVDCQLQTPSGAVALAELATGPQTLMLRTRTGPQLVTREGIRAVTTDGPGDLSPGRLQS
ncbi:malonate decarboxylase holo-ACP synthase [Streptomyces sp. NBC_00121]|uniref:malonate decarboxylase holo-ACP synthase n=1 Tax=unclassified Streptomyces TaxID=2593676 RepID=UPI0028C4FE7B|nr:MULTISPECIES: malonate decarboxylase holo-ACP synthase [unclassified Streptomyces]WNO62450.1 malonate decarboxylase holo-ACP synthase [Streptomyces sp. AM2-3-1]WSC67044.1 malonate decarboxylase holo-ACP synthase [Streptomyces sp. NBC_01760]WTE57416.1 malonate decarboxylase holo-ACP synthase [Streptomyces sp. NBC_01617]WTI84926.1 malonate decarboxylase holo-ACP synthase [Streptomyces sp. NBC_00724]